MQACHLLHSYTVTIQLQRQRQTRLLPFEILAEVHAVKLKSYCKAKNLLQL